MSNLRLIQCGVGGMGKTWWGGPVRSSPDFELVAIVDSTKKDIVKAQ